MVAAGERGSIVSLICDGGARYGDTYYDDAWLGAQGLDPGPHREVIDRFWASGRWDV
jgi:cysteine synthase A